MAAPAQPILTRNPRETTGDGRPGSRTGALPDIRLARTVRQVRLVPRHRTESRTRQSGQKNRMIDATGGNASPNNSRSARASVASLSGVPVPDDAQGLHLVQAHTDYGPLIEVLWGSTRDAHQRRTVTRERGSAHEGSSQKGWRLSHWTGYGRATVSVRSTSWLIWRRRLGL